MAGAEATGAGVSVTGSSAVEAAAAATPWSAPPESSNQPVTFSDRNSSSMESDDGKVDCEGTKEGPQCCVLSIPPEQPSKPSVPFCPGPYQNIVWRKSVKQDKSREQS